MDKRLPIIYLLVLIFATGCATIIHGKLQKIPVTSEPSGATVTVDGQTVETPGVVILKRSREEYTLRFEKEGYKPVEIKLHRSMSGWLWGNLLIGGVIGVIVDFSTGSAYKLEPKEVHAILKAKGISLKELENLKGDIVVFADMEEFQNWIQK
jgi:hypothetical protein